MAKAQIIGGDGWSIQGTDPVEIFHGKRRVSSYHSGFGDGLPHLAPIIGPGGAAVTATAEKASSQGRGIWVSLGDVNGYSFHPTPNSEKKRGRIFHKGMNGVHIQKSLVALRMKAEWLDAVDDTKRICSDRRELTFGLLPDRSLVFDLLLELIADAGDLTIGPESLGIFSMQLIPQMLEVKKMGKAAESADATAKADVAASNPGQSGTRAPWLSCQGKDARGEAAGVALLDHPQNSGAPATWVTREDGLVSANPFSDSSKTPMRIANGDSLKLHYRTIFYQPSSAFDPQKAFDEFSSKAA